MDNSLLLLKSVNFSNDNIKPFEMTVRDSLVSFLASDKSDSKWDRDEFSAQLLKLLIECPLSIGNITTICVNLLTDFPFLCSLCLFGIREYLKNTDVLDAVAEQVTLSILVLLSKHIVGEHKQDNPKEVRKQLGRIWYSFCQKKLQFTSIKTVLSEIDAVIFPSVSNPRLFGDFLSLCVDNGGIIGIMALNGLFVLMTEYNFEYPNFYTELYGLVTIDTFKMKNKFNRFFQLFNVFLSSSHLPAYISASFIKKLARLCLFIPEDKVIIVLSLILNLLRRCPTALVLINRETDDNSNYDADPFIFDEHDPSKSNALSSSLWEVGTLQYHWSPRVSTLAMKVNAKLGDIEEDIDSLLEDDDEEGDNQDVFNDDLKETIDEGIATEFRPQTSFQDDLSELGILL